MFLQLPWQLCRGGWYFCQAKFITLLSFHKGLECKLRIMSSLSDSLTRENWWHRSLWSLDKKACWKGIHVRTRRGIHPSPDGSLHVSSCPIVSFEAASVKVIFMVSPLPPHEIQIPERGVHSLTISLQLSFAWFECSNFLLHCPFTNFTFHFHGTYAYVLSKSQIIVQGLCWKKKKSISVQPQTHTFSNPQR